ncbi:PH domain-containing protein [Sinobaca sp. H24]|uniref:PH domain-containing protein n=1 Tax=Sinobaca sp. H24 TaxID=2923376 RepID=UPI00207AA5D5|nr:PH domain-containing protein [Sinobaca sp. H24]
MRMTNSWKRMHGAAVVVLFVTRIKDFIFPLLLTFFAGGTGTLFGQEWIFPALLLVLFLHSLFSWLFFRFRLEEQELRIKQGIFVKKRRYIQRKKVQSVDISAGIIQRTFGLVKIKIETAGGGMVPEVSIIALSKMMQKSPRISSLRSS